MEEARTRNVVVQFLCCACGAANSFPRREPQGVLSCEACGAEQPTAPDRRSALGKFSHLPGSSDDFARPKQDEIDLEDRAWRPPPET